MTPEWKAGAVAEAQARDEGLSAEVKDVRYALEGLARLHGYGAFPLTSALARIYSAGQPFRRRLRLAWQILRR